MSHDEIILKFLDLHPDTPLDGHDRYAVPLGTISRMLEAAAKEEREDWEFKMKILYEEYAKVKKHRDLMLAAKMQDILEKEPV